MTNRVWWSGVMFGGMLSLAMLGGYWLGARGTQANPAVTIDRVKAVSGYGTETFALCTGLIDNNMEGVFTLDYLTGDLQCWVLSPRTGNWGALYKHNVAGDLEVEKGKKPSFVMTTGLVNLPASGGMKRPAQSVVYVADANTGKFACYAVPIIPGAQAAGLNEFGPMVILAKGNARSVEVRQ